MNKISNSLFKKFESNQVENLAKVVGGQPQGTIWTGGGASGTDTLEFGCYNGWEICDDNYCYKADFVITSTNK
jgi:hypothetical protein